MGEVRLEANPTFFHERACISFFTCIEQYATVEEVCVCLCDDLVHSKGGLTSICVVYRILDGAEETFDGCAGSNGSASFGVVVYQVVLCDSYVCVDEEDHHLTY
jgi:hypothetical protein